MNNQQPQYYQQPPQPQNFQQPPQPPKKKLKTWQIVLIVIGALLVLGAIASAGSSSENENDKSSPASSAQTMLSPLPLLLFPHLTINQSIILSYITISQSIRVKK